MKRVALAGLVLPLFNFIESLTQNGSVFLTSLAAFTSEVASA